MERGLDQTFPRLTPAPMRIIPNTHFLARTVLSVPKAVGENVQSIPNGYSPDSEIYRASVTVSFDWAELENGMKM